jgi:hypothetical protein
VTADILRGIAKVLQDEANACKPDSLEWAYYQDAADTLVDLAEWLDRG